MTDLTRGQGETGKTGAVALLPTPLVAGRSQVLSRLGRHSAALVAFGLPFLLYLLTLAPTVYSLDSAELSVAAHTGGLAHPTGYPLYLTLGWLWSRLPLGDVGYRMNLFSALWAALTLALADRILRRLGVGPWARFGALGLLAVSTYFWGMALIAEVYTMQTALTAGLILALLRWDESPSAGRLALVGLVSGLALTHHATSFLLLPGCLVYLLSRGGFSWSALVRSRTRTAAANLPLLASQTRPSPAFPWFPLLAAGLVGLAPLLYLPLRYAARPAFNYAGWYDAGLVFHPIDLLTFDGLAWMITGRAFTGLAFAYNAAGLGREAIAFAGGLVRAFFALGIGPGLLGLVLLFRRNRRPAGLLALLFALPTAFYIDYRAVDKVTMFLPSYLIFALWVGMGYEALLEWLGGPPARDERPAAAASREIWAARALIAAAVLLAGAWNLPRVDLSTDRSARQYGEAILAAVRPGALIFTYWDGAPVIEYLQLSEGRRPDVRSINRFLINPVDVDLAIKKEAPRRPVYIDRPSAAMQAEYQVVRAGPIYRLYPRLLPEE